MDTPEYNHLGKRWRQCPTTTQGDSFFHSVFGRRDKDDQPYFDKHAAYRRKFWSRFLTYFDKNKKMPESLADLLQKCFDASDKYRHNRIDDRDSYSEYTKDVTLSEYWVLVEEIPILATLQNTRVVLFRDNCEEPEVFEPNPEILGKFRMRRTEHAREFVICLVDNNFLRLNPYDEPITIQDTNEKSQTKTNSTCKKNYKKRGSAGIEGSLYQINLLTMVLLNGLRKVDNWRLSTEDDEADKFDDLIFEYLPSESAVLLQAKHKKNETKKITYEDLISTKAKSEFSLPKYFVSYLKARKHFKVLNLLICTNAKFHQNMILDGVLIEERLNQKSILYFDETEQQNIVYSFNSCFMSELKQSIETYCSDNLRNEEIIYFEEDIDDYLSHLQLFPNCLSGENADNVLEKIISREALSRNLDSKAILKDILEKMTNWFKEEKGRYLTQVEAKAFFCDFRSNKFCETLKLDISFDKNELPFVGQSQQNDKRTFHIIPEKEYILNVIKIYRTLQKYEKEKVSLFVNLDEAIDDQKHIIDAFEVSHYTFLVIVSSKTINGNIERGICNKVMDILNKFKYKRVILIAEEKSKLAAQIKNANVSFYKAITDPIKFTDLTSHTQEKFKKKNVNFQGITLSLEELFKAVKNENLNQILNSEILVKLARDYIINIGLELNNPDNYYVYRSFNRNGHNISEEKMCQSEEMNKKHSILISDSAGMGKSTVFTSLAMVIKSYNPHLWVVRIDLNSYTNIMKASLKKRAKSVSLMQLLDSQERCKLKNDFEKKLFITPGRVVLMLDGVDEICPSYYDLVLNLIKESLTQPNIAKILVTTRPHLRVDLEQALKVQSFTLEPFSEDNQIEFLKKYWMEKLDLQDDINIRRCESYATALIEKISRWINDGASNTFAGIPLQTSMLAEVFQEDHQATDKEHGDWEGCKEFLSSDDEEPKLPNRINLIQLYEMFIDTKREIFINDKSNAGGNVIVEESLMGIFEECHDYHRSYALELLFYTHEWNYFSCYKKLEQSTSFVVNYLLKAGIIQSVNGELQFIHRTFAEYFAAKCVLVELENENVSAPFIRLLDIVLYWERYTVIRMFFDSFVEKELHNMPNTTLRRFSTYFKGHNDSYLIWFASGGYVGIVSFLIKCMEFQSFKYNNLEGTEYINALLASAYRGHLDVVKVLAERVANVDMRDVSGDTALRMAVLGGRLDVVKFLVEEANANVNRTNIEGKSILHHAVALQELLKLLESSTERYKCKIYRKTTAADNKDHLDVVRFLVDETGIDVNVRDLNGCTALHVAAFWGHLNIVEVLVKRGADVHVRNNMGDTACRAADLGKHPDVVEFLKANVNTNGKSVSYVTALKGHLELLKRLKSENKIYYKASYRDHLKKIEFLEDETDRDVNHCSVIQEVLSSYLDDIKFLVEGAADVNMEFAFRKLVLGGHLDVVKLLVQESKIRLPVVCTHPAHVFLKKLKL